MSQWILSNLITDFLDKLARIHVPSGVGRSPVKGTFNLLVEDMSETGKEQMQFTIKRTSGGMRVGEILLGKYRAKTPNVLVSTSRLTVPHTTLDRFRKIALAGGEARVAGVITYTDKFFENPKLVASDLLPAIHKFGALEEFPVFLGLESGLDVGVEKLNNGKDFVTVTNTSGACKVPIKALAELCNKLQPDVMIYPHSRVTVSAPEKHLNRAAQRSAEYIKIFAEHFKGNVRMMEPVLRGDSSMDVFGRMFVNIEEATVASRLGEVKDTDGLRYAPGMFTPTQVVQLIRSGIDLVDTSFVDHITNQHQALIVDTSSDKFGEYVLLSLEKDEYFEDLEVIQKGCGCLACSDAVTKSYIHHLIKTHEMLTTVHLQAHNLHQYLLLVEALRSSNQLEFKH